MSSNAVAGSGDQTHCVCHTVARVNLKFTRAEPGFCMYGAQPVAHGGHYLLIRQFPRVWRMPGMSPRITAVRGYRAFGR
jgi:hypothetical protein